MVTDYIPIKPYKKYTVTTFNEPYYSIGLFDKDKNYLGRKQLSAATPCTFTIDTENVVYIRFTVRKSIMETDYKEYMMVEGETLPSVFSDRNKVCFEKDIQAPNLKLEYLFTRFEGKKLLVIGDSITETNFRTAKNYHYYLKKWLKLDSVINEGKSGTGLVKPSGGNLGALNRLNDFTTDCDLILYMGNMNDGTGGTGALTEVGTFEDTEPNTVYGAWRCFIERLIEKYPNKPIIVCLSTPRSQVGDLGVCWGKKGWYENWLKASKEICENYSIPFLDLYHNSGLRPWNNTNKAEYFSCDQSPDDDGIHPNEKGHLLLAYKIYEFIKQYL